MTFNSTGTPPPPPPQPTPRAHARALGPGGGCPGRARTGTRTGNLGPSGLDENPDPGCPDDGTVPLSTVATAARLGLQPERSFTLVARGLVVL